MRVADFYGRALCHFVSKICFPICYECKHMNICREMLRLKLSTEL